MFLLETFVFVKQYGEGAAVLATHHVSNSMMDIYPQNELF